MKLQNKDFIFAIIAVILGVLTRTIFDLGQNIEMVTAFAIVSGYFFNNKKLAFAVPLITMIVSDIFIKNTNIFLFTWSGFLFGPIAGSLLRRLVNKFKGNFALGLVGSQGLGVVSTLVFFLWTNFGVWLIGNMYVKDLSGLTLSYINAIPFLVNQLVGNLVIVPIVFVLGTVYYNYEKIINPIINKSIE